MKTANLARRASNLVAVLFALGLVGCGGPPPPSPPPSPTATSSRSPSPPATATPQESPSPTATATPQPTSQLPAGFTCADASGGSEQAGSNVVGVRIGQHDGYDRLVIEFSGAIPSYKVQLRSGTSFTESPRGQTVILSGTNGELVVVHPVFNWTPNSGPFAFKPGFPILREARQIENFEGYQQWALGIKGTPCLRVTTLASPPRLVVDVATTR